jgi:hypothetical protein
MIKKMEMNQLVGMALFTSTVWVTGFVSGRLLNRKNNQIDNSMSGTFRRCSICQDGLRREPKPRPRPSTKPPLLALFIENLVESRPERRTYPVRPTRSYHTPRPAMDFNVPSHVELKATEPKPEPSVVELTFSEDDPILTNADSNESPETLELDYTLGKRKYKHGETVWTRKTEYVVDSLRNNILYLVRKDVWEDRKKKAEHVELNFDKSAEHVELKAEDENPGEIVELKFD